MKRAALHRRQVFVARHTRGVEQVFDRLTQCGVGVLALHCVFHGKRPCLLRVYLALIGVQLLTAIAVGFRIGLVVSTCALIAVELVGVVIILLLSLVVA